MAHQHNVSYLLNLLCSAAISIALHMVSLSGSCWYDDI